MNSHSTETGPVPLWLWRATLGALASVVLIGLAAALWLGTRPVARGRPVPTDLLSVWNLRPGAAGGPEGERFLLRTDTQGIVYVTAEPTFENVSFQLRARWLGGPDDAGYGLIVRYRGPQDFSALLVAGDGYIAAGEMADGVWRWHVPWRQWPHIRRGSLENLLRAECSTGVCRFFVNDELAFELESSSPQGRIGLAVWVPEPGSGSLAAFRQWQAWTP